MELGAFAGWTTEDHEVGGLGRERRPTTAWAYKWDVLNEMTDDPSVMYKLYRSEMDAITPKQVN